MATRLERCRVCRGELYKLLELGEFALCGHFPLFGEKVPVEPMGLSACANCNLVQMHYSYRQDLYGSNYGYRSGLNQSMVRHLRDTAVDGCLRVQLKPDDVVLDIGGNDGTLLSFIEHPNRVLVDPTAPNWKIDPDITVIPEVFTGQVKRAKLVFSIAMFYDLEDPVSLARQVAEILDYGGVWVLEQSYLPTMVYNTAFDTICHEHLEYYTLGALKTIMGLAGLEIFSATTNDTNGGSIRIMVGHQGQHAIEDFWVLEGIDIAFNKQLTEKFSAMEGRMEDMRVELIQAIAKERYVVGFGASTKGNTLLQYCKLTSQDVVFIVDVNESKHWRCTPGTQIPIVPENWAKAFLPYTYLVLPWHFRKSILETHTPFLQDGGKFLFPLPQVELIADVHRGLEAVA